MKYLEAQALAAKASDTKGSGRKNRPGPAENKLAVAPVVTEQEPVAPVAPGPEPDAREDDFTRTEEVDGAEFTAPEAPAASAKSTKGKKSDQ